MVAETPTDGRCNARVVDKIGLTVECTHADDAEEDKAPDLVLTDQLFDIARLVGPDGAVIDAEPNYESVRKFLWDDYQLSHIGAKPDEDADEDPIQGLRDQIGDIEAVSVIADYAIDPPDTTIDVSSDGDVVWIHCESIVDNVTNRTSEHQGFCERYEMKEIDRCYVHQGGGAPEGNTNSMTHGIYAKRSNFYQALDQEDQQYVEALVDSWVTSAPFDRDDKALVDTLYRCAIDQLKSWFGNDEYIDEHGDIEGLVKTQEVFDGEEVHEIEDEQSINMAYSRLTNDVRQELKDLGIYDSPEAQQAKATESLAKKLSGLSDD